MQLNSTRIFPRIVIKQTPLEPHSRLAHLEPIGVGTPLVESLTSYISRLAETHSLKLSTLFQFEILPHLDKPYLLAGNKDDLYTGTFSFWRVKNLFEAINGLSDTSIRFVAALEHLTKRRDLKHLTLLNWINVLTPHTLLRRYKLWCPDCLEVWRTSKQPIYDPLLWNINEVKICSIHQKGLVSSCPHCNNQACLLGTKSRAGHCPVCEKWLGKSNNNDSTYVNPAGAELDFQLWAIENVGEILAKGPALQSLYPQSNLDKSISTIIDCCYEGVIQKLATAMGKSKSSVWGWKTGAHRPSLREILIICYITGTSLSDFLASEGSIKSCLFTLPRYSNMKSSTKIMARPRKVTDVEDVRLKLKKYMRADIEPTPMTQVAEQIGYGLKVLRKEFPELCKQISERYLSHRKAVSKKKRSDFIDEITSAVFHLHSIGQPITRDRIANHLNKPEYGNNPLVCGPMRAAKRKLHPIVENTGHE